jgi:hypothetical protein
MWLALAGGGLGESVARSQGTVTFANSAGTAVIDARSALFQPAAAGQFRVGLYYSANLSDVPELNIPADSFRLLGTAVAVLNGGIFLGGTRAIPGVAAGVPVQFQVRGWTLPYDSYEAAFNGASSGDTTVAVGASKVMQVILGGGANPTPSLGVQGGLMSFAIGVPEPSAWGVGSLGLLVVLGATRMRSRRRAAYS